MFGFKKDKKRTYRPLIGDYERSKDEIKNAINPRARISLIDNAYGSYNVKFSPLYIEKIQTSIVLLFQLISSIKSKRSGTNIIYTMYFNDIDLSYMERVATEPKKYIDGIFGNRTKQDFLNIMEIIFTNQKILNSITLKDKVYPYTDKFKMMVCLSYTPDILFDLSLFIQSEIEYLNQDRDSSIHIEYDTSCIRHVLHTDETVKHIRGDVYIRSNPIHRPKVNTDLNVIDGNTLSNDKSSIVEYESVSIKISDNKSIKITKSDVDIPLDKLDAESFRAGYLYFSRFYESERRELYKDSYREGFIDGQGIGNGSIDPNRQILKLQEKGLN